ncbi:MAG: thymidylate kinase [Candidatus Thermoplasmatota archaeon]|nr:thymidylate kinase [Candidatus Thermoplasmatota archaeon]
MKLIVVDGLDGCGKNAHADSIKRLLEGQGEKVTVVSHPSRRLFGRLSKRFLEDSGAGARLFATLFFTLDVLMSVRWYHKQKTGNVIFVRYLLGTAYLPESLAPIGYRFFRNLLPFPDIALFIDIEPEVARRRIASRGHAPEMFETPEKLTATRRVARSLVAEEWVTIDNSKDGERPFKEVEAILRERSILGPAVGP